MIGVGKHVDRRAVHHVSGRIGAVELAIGAPQEIAGVFCAREHGVDVDVHARGLLEEGVTDSELVDARGEAESGRDAQHQDDIFFIFVPH